MAKSSNLEGEGKFGFRSADASSVSTSSDLWVMCGYVVNTGAKLLIIIDDGSIVINEYC